MKTCKRQETCPAIPPATIGLPGIALTRIWVIAAVVASMLIAGLAGCARLAALRQSLERETGERPRQERQAARPKVAPWRSIPALEGVATSERLWTGVAVSKDGRIFVNYPRWSEDVPISVAEIRKSGGTEAPRTVEPFPDAEWNTWNPSEDLARSFVCVQSVYVDRDNFLWVLDTGNAFLRGIVPGGAKLVKIDLRQNSAVQEIAFDETAAPAASYLNDVRVDTAKRVAYITDSGLGALVVVDLETGRSRRVLADHGSMKSENVVLSVGGREWRPGGQVPKIHADGVALDGTGDYLYYHALTGRNLYRIETRYLIDPGLSAQQLAAKVESLGATGACDGMEFGPDGYLYLTGIEDNSIRVFASIGNTETVIKDPRLVWPDSFARGSDGYMYVTTSQLHLGVDSKEPFGLFRFKVE